MPDKEDQLWEELKRWAAELRFGDLCVKFKVHQGKIVGVEDMPTETKRVVKI